MYSCSNNIPFQRPIVIRTHAEYDSTRNAEARDDSIQMEISLYANAKFTNVVAAKAQTPPVESLYGEDAADDPAIWYNPKHPEKSAVIGTQKKSGLYVYDIKGNTLQFIKAGSINNVDLRDGFVWNGKKSVLVAGSNRSINTISLFILDPETLELSDSILNIPSSVDEVYGICMMKSEPTNSFYIFVNGKGGMVEQWQISSVTEELTYELIRTFQLAKQPEGMVADDINGILYLGVEEEGIYKISALTTQDTTILYRVENSDSTNPNIMYDIEGLSLYQDSINTYLIASSQGNFSYAIWKTSNNLEEKDKYLTSFVIWEIPGSGIDGVEETDGLDIVSHYINEDYPRGLLVVQDGFNFEGDSLVNQNFKYISWEDIIPFLEKD
jgi:3-phytase